MEKKVNKNNVKKEQAPKKTIKKETKSKPKTQIPKKEKSDKSVGRFRRLFHSRKFWFIFGIIIIILITLGSHFYLYLVYLLGNDVIVRVDRESNDFFLSHGETTSINIKGNVLANLFCRVECNYILSDLSQGEKLDSGILTLRSTNSFTRQYNFTAPEKGTGQELYRFDIECKGIKSNLCYTGDKISRKSVLITLNYNLTKEETLIKENLEDRFHEISKKMNLYEINLDLIESLLRGNENLSFGSLERLISLKVNFSKIKNRLEEFNQSWILQDYNPLNKDLEDIEISSQDFETEYINFTSSTLPLFEEYNLGLEKTKKISSNLNDFKNTSLSNDSISLLSSFVDEFNHFVLTFSNIKSIETKIQVMNKLEDDFSNLLSSIKSNEESSIDINYYDNYSLNDFEFQNLTLKLLNSSKGHYLPEISPMCCLNQSCYTCCNESCSSNESLYPVIFLHGHDFNADVSPDYNLNAFSDIQRELEKRGVIYDFGSIIINVPSMTTPNVWGSIQSRIGIRASYYYDSIFSNDEVDVLETKKDNIDTYAIRLKDIIDSVRIKTGKDKVILVSHSMGGLVIRRYVQIFNDSAIDRAILITSPNHGVVGTVKEYCGFFGSDIECEDLAAGSLLLNKLSNQKAPQSKFYNIIGIGCDMDGDTGDGIVKNESAYLDWAENYYLEGQCDSLKFIYFHNDILITKMYPEVVDLLENFLS